MIIYAILLNPSIDQIYKINNFNVGGTFKVNKNIIYPVGKAISFSLAVRELDKNIKLKIIAFIGKNDVQLYSTFLISKNIDFEFIQLEENTRSNKTIIDPINKTTTHIREKGFSLNLNNVTELKRILKINIEKDNICVFSGSIPQNTKVTIYRDLIKICKKKGGICILDTDEMPLIEGLKSNPFIIKPNLLELSYILRDETIINLDFSEPVLACIRLIDKSKKLLYNNTKIVLITLGENGAILMTNSVIKYGYLRLENIVDTVGSGDSFLAGFILFFFRHNDLDKAFRYALATSAANIQNPGPGIFDYKNVEIYLEKVKIIDLNQKNL